MDEDENEEDRFFLERARELLNHAAEDLDRPTQERLEQMRLKVLGRVDDWLERLFEEIQKKLVPMIRTLSTKFYSRYYPVE